MKLRDSLPPDQQAIYDKVTGLAGGTLAADRWDRDWTAVEGGPVAVAERGAAPGDNRTEIAAHYARLQREAAARQATEERPLNLLTA